MRIMDYDPKLVLAGAGKNGICWLERLRREGIEVFCFADRDENKIGQELCGKKIVSYCDLNKFAGRTDIFITALRNDIWEEIEETLLDFGLGKQIIGCYLYDNAKISEKSYVRNSYLEGKNFIAAGTKLENSYLGKCSYISSDSYIIHTKVGRFTCIGPEVRIIIGQHPTSDIVSVHPAFYSAEKWMGYSFVEETKFSEVRLADQEYSVVIGNDVWVGMGAKIMEGVTIADGSIIAAGAVVTRDTEPFEIVGGIPARHIKYRFEKKACEKLLEIQWWNKSMEWIQEHAEEFVDIHAFLKGKLNEE